VSKTNWALFPLSPQSSYSTLVGFIGIYIYIYICIYVDVHMSKCPSLTTKPTLFPVMSQLEDQFAAILNDFEKTPYISVP
jgi:hypothetical protein